MSKQTDPKGGGEVTPEEQELGQQLSDWAESEDFTIPDSADIFIDGDPETVFAELEASINRRGRPALAGPAGAGESPVLRFRVPTELRDELAEVAKRQNRKQSVVMRDALADYLHKAS